MARAAEMEEERASELLKVKNLREEVKRNPTLHRQIELEAWRKLEVQRDYAFQQMEDIELHRLGWAFSAHKMFWAWRKQAQKEWQQLRETEQSSKERLEQIMDNFLLAKEKEARNPYMVEYTDYQKVLPITTPAAFALEHYHTPELHLWFKSRAAKIVSPSTWPPGKRFSLCDILQTPCKLEHHPWMKESVGLELLKGSGCGDRTIQKRLGLWQHLAKLMWRDNVGPSHVVEVDSN